MVKFLERFRRPPLLQADAPLPTRWAEVAPRQQLAADFQPGTTKARKHHRGQSTDSQSANGAKTSSASETNKRSQAHRQSPENLKARELKDLLRARNLDTRGTKAQLVSRLQEAYKLEL